MYNQIGNTDKVIANMEEIIEVAKKEEVPDIIKIAAYNGLGVSYTKKKSYEKALLYLNELKNYGEVTDNSEVALTALDNLGYLCYQRQLWDKVIELGEESLEYSDANGMSKRPVALLNLGMAYVKKMEPEIAVPYLKEALKIANAWEFISQMPAGLDTNIGDSGNPSFIQSELELQNISDFFTFLSDFFMDVIFF